MNESELLRKALWPTAMYIVVLIVFGGLYWVADLSPDLGYCLHFSVDTITLRGRIGDVEDNLWCQFLSNLEALLAIAIIVVWFPIVFAAGLKPSPNSDQTHEG